MHGAMCVCVCVLSAADLCLDRLHVRLMPVIACLALCKRMHAASSGSLRNRRYRLLACLRASHCSTCSQASQSAPVRKPFTASASALCLCLTATKSTLFQSLSFRLSSLPVPVPHANCQSDWRCRPLQTRSVHVERLCLCAVLWRLLAGQRPPRGEATLAEARGRCVPPPAAAAAVSA